MSIELSDDIKYLLSKYNVQKLDKDTWGMSTEIIVGEETLGYTKEFSSTELKESEDLEGLLQKHQDMLDRLAVELSADK